jgi:hypothetical protein
VVLSTVYGSLYRLPSLKMLVCMHSLESKVQVPVLRRSVCGSSGQSGTGTG